MIKGRATAEGTQRYAARFALPIPHWKPALGLTLSSIGMGSYLGRPDEKGDRAYAEATKKALALGCNLIDTAINYRYQRSERAIGRGLREAIDAGIVRRDEVVLCTKGGFIPFDGAPPSDPQQWFKEALLDPGIAEPSDIVGGCHCMTPRYIEKQIEWSLKNLGLETIDVYHLHNPETQLDEVPAEEFEERLAEAFKTLEKAAKDGRIQVYGTATWTAYREPGRLSLAKVVRIAEAVGGRSHHFKIIQLPYNLAMPEALIAPTQDKRSAIEAAQKLGLAVVTSVPLLQTKLLSALPQPLHARFPGLATNAQRCIQFARSTPGVIAPLVGMSNPAHVEENMATAKTPPLDPAPFAELLRALSR